MIFGKPPAKSVEVKLRVESDPTKMMMEKGMDDFVKKVKMINFGNKQPVKHHLHQAVLGDSKHITKIIFTQNIKKQTD